MSTFQLPISTDFVLGLNDEDFNALALAVIKRAQQTNQQSDTTHESLVERFGADGQKQLGDISLGKQEPIQPTKLMERIPFYSAPLDATFERCFLTQFGEQGLTVPVNSNGLLQRQVPFRFAECFDVNAQGNGDLLRNNGIIGISTRLDPNNIHMKSVYLRIHEQLFRLKVQPLPHSRFVPSPDGKIRIIDLRVNVRIDESLQDIHGAPFKYAEAYGALDTRLTIQIKGDYHPLTSTLFVKKPSVVFEADVVQTQNSELALCYLRTLVEPLAYDIDAVWDY